MGVIISGLRIISEPYNYILQKSKDVHVYSLTRELEKFVNGSFGALKPLSHEYKEACQMDKEDYSDGGMLCIGTWLRSKYSRHYKYGSTIDDIFPYIRKYGDELKEHVRGPIKDDFADAVDLTKELKDYEDIEETITISPRKLCRYWIHESVKTNEKEVRKLWLSTSSPKRVIMKSSEDDEDPWRIDIDNDDSPAALEDVIDSVVRLYDMVDAKLAVVREHNRRIMSQIDQVVTPYKLLNAFK